MAELIGAYLQLFVVNAAKGNPRQAHIYLVGFEVLTAVSMKMAVFWVAAPCSLVDEIGRAHV
jgi:hypothetical protein